MHKIKCSACENPAFRTLLRDEQVDKCISYHPEWQKNRIDYISRNYAEYFDASKTLINMGAFHGDLSYLIHEKFRHLAILNEEGRKQNVCIGSQKYPQFGWNQINYENCNLSELPKADIIFNMGLFYHLSSDTAKSILQASINRANKIVFFESEVIDSDIEEKSIQVNGNSHQMDQSMSKLEARTSILYINKILDEMNCDYDFIESSELNGGGHTYDWNVENTGKWVPTKRKFWIIMKSFS